MPRRRTMRGLPARRRRNGAMILLEVIVSLVILGVSVAAIMRSFTVSMSAIRKNDVTTTACVLAEGLLQELELDSPKSRGLQGNFEAQGFPRYFWSVKFEEEEVRYRHLKTKSRIDNLRPLKYLKLTVTYDDGVRPRFNPVETEIYLPPIERFTQKSRFSNELFKDENS